MNIEETIEEQDNRRAKMRKVNIDYSNPPGSFGIALLLMLFYPIIWIGCWIAEIPGKLRKQEPPL